MNRNERRRLAAGREVPPDALAQAFAAHQAGDLRAAERVYKSVLARAPDEPEALRLLGELYLDSRRFDEAVRLLRRLVALLPASFMAQYSLGNGYRLAGDLVAAEAVYRESLRLRPDFAGAWHGLGAVCVKAGREAEGADCFAAAVRHKPDWAAAWLDLGTTQAACGDLAAAARALQRAVALQPGLSEAWRHLAAISGQSDAVALTRRVADPKVGPAERIDLHFALGRLDDEAGRFEPAFAHFQAANRLLRAAQMQAGVRYDRARMTADVDKLIAAFPREAFAEVLPGANESGAPVFIVGMPRAGSSLFEQIAASHSGVFGAGETKGIGAIAGKIGWRPGLSWSREALEAATAWYLAGLRAPSGAARIVDKMPDNVFHLGLIAALFPNARVVFCARDARDTCLSCYFQHFAEPYGFDTDLEDCAHRYQEIERLMRHWQAVLPLRMIVLDYDALVANLEREAKRLIGFLGLAWEPGCLDFHKTKRVVRTASWAQVRQKLYQKSSGRWRNYQTFLRVFDGVFGDG
jgi:tetratricopeptide (TPR) repeat protein